MRRVKSKLLILSITFTMCMLFAVLMGNFSTAKAQVGLATNLTMQGSSIRVEEPTGLRFAYSVDDYDELVNANTNYGMLIVPYDYLADAGILEVVDGVDYVNVLKNAKQQMLINYDPIVVENVKPILVDGSYVVQHSIASIYESNYNRSWFAIGFIKDGENYVYSKIGDKNVRDVLYVASAVLNRYYYDEAFETEKPEMFEQAKNNETLLKNFVTKGIANVTEELSYAIEGGKKSVWKGVTETFNLKITETKYVNLNTYWMSSNNNVATIDQNGKVTIVGEGSVRITAKSCELYSATYDITVFDRQSENQEGEILFVTEEGGATGFANASGSGNFTLATADQLAGISGEYKGNAVVANIPTSEYCVPKIYPRITEEDWDNAIEDGYSKMYVWIAVTLSNDVQKININNQAIATSGVLQRSDGAHSGTINVKTWTKFTFDLTEENKVKMFNANGAKLIQLYYYLRPADVTYEVFVGNVGFDSATRDFPVQEGEIAFVNNEKDVINFANAASSDNFTLATEDQLAGISGEYKGNAVVANITGEYCVPKIYPRITEEDWDNAVKSGYTNMYVWIAITTPEHKGALVLNNEDISKSKVLERSDSGNPTLGTWKKVTFALSEANKAKMFDANGAKLVQIYYWTNPNYTAYVGNVGFDSATRDFPVQEGEIAFVNNEKDVINFANASSSGNFALATGDQLASISGEYKGNAVVANIRGEYCMPKIYPRIAEEDWDNAIENGYSKMYVWVAVVLSNDVQKINVNNEAIATSGVLKRSDGAHSGTINVKTWTKFTFDLTEENKTKMFDANGARLIQLYYWQRPADVTYEVFVGNVGFCI